MHQIGCLDAMLNRTGKKKGFCNPSLFNILFKYYIAVIKQALWVVKKDCTKRWVSCVWQTVEEEVTPRSLVIEGDLSCYNRRGSEDKSHEVQGSRSTRESKMSVTESLRFIVLSLEAAADEESNKLMKNLSSQWLATSLVN